jgi:hypothetical protein
MNPTTTAFTLFCDDIRPEVGGKLSVMGIYQGFMGIPGAEIVLPKFVAWNVLVFPGRWSSNDVQVQLLDGDQVLTDARVSMEPSPGLPSNGMANEDGCTFLNVPLEAAPFVARSGMALRVRVKAEGLDYQSEVLRVIDQTQLANAPM